MTYEPLHESNEPFAVGDWFDLELMVSARPGYAARNRRATLCAFVHNGPRAAAAPRVSDDQEMQLWTLAPRGIACLARPQGSFS